MRKLERDRHRVDVLEDDVAELRNSLVDLETTHERDDRNARERDEELDNKLRSVKADLGEATRALNRLADRMDWMERHIRASGAAQEIDFDRLAGEYATLVGKIEQGHRARDELLDDHTRSQLQTWVALQDDQAQRIDQLTTTALQASSALATTGYGGKKHTAAADVFRAAFAARQTETKKYQEHRDRAAQARTRLTKDDLLRTQHAPAIQAGTAAAQQMRLRVRTTIAAALGNAALPPVWFTNELGMTPPRGAAEEWLDTAADLVAYRLTYNIEDPLSALGQEPDPSNTARQRWYRNLDNQLRHYR